MFPGDWAEKTSDEYAGSNVYITSEYFKNPLTGQWVDLTLDKRETKEAILFIVWGLYEVTD